MDLLNNLRSQFSQLRIKSKIDRQQLEKSTKSGGGSVGLFENAKSDITVGKLVRWCEALGLEVRLVKKVKSKSTHPSRTYEKSFTEKKSFYEE